MKEVQESHAFTPTCTRAAPGGGAGPPTSELMEVD
jgi:hypothetical protein